MLNLNKFYSGLAIAKYLKEKDYTPTKQAFEEYIYDINKDGIANGQITSVSYDISNYVDDYNYFLELKSFVEAIIDFKLN